MEFKNYGLLVKVTPPIGMTSWGGGTSTKTTTLNIYQPSSLKLKAGIPVQTQEGTYTSQRDVVWHSDARYWKLERELFD